MNLYNNCLGTKVAYHDNEGNVSHEYQWKSYDQIYEEIQILANVIIDNQLYSAVDDNDFGLTLNVLGISSVNREEWILTDLAANLLGITTVPLYETLGQDMMIQILEQTQMSTLFGNDKCLTNIL